MAKINLDNAKPFRYNYVSTYMTTTKEQTNMTTTTMNNYRITIDVRNLGGDIEVALDLVEYILDNANMTEGYFSAANAHALSPDEYELYFHYNTVSGQESANALADDIAATIDSITTGDISFIAIRQCTN
jgi:hypothetical protein